MSTFQSLKQLINQYKLFYYLPVSFTYGFLRSFNGQYDAPNDVLGNRLGLGLMNGVCYCYPPLTLHYTFKLINRIDIKLTGKDPEKYKDMYEDMFSNNTNVFI